MTDIKIGDKVRLTGEYWGRGLSPKIGDIVTISGISQNGSPEFYNYGDGWAWYVCEGYEGELVESNPVTESHSVTEEYVDALYAELRKRNAILTRSELEDALKAVEENG